MNELNLADAHIDDLRAAQDSVDLRLTTWDGKPLRLLFSGVIAFESEGALGTDLSHLTAGGHIDYVRRAADRAEIDEAAVRCFAFVSSWSDVPVLKIVARTMSEIPSSGDARNG